MGVRHVRCWSCNGSGIGRIEEIIMPDGKKHTKVHPCKICKGRGGWLEETKD